MFTAVAFVMLGNYYGYDSVGPVAEQLTRELCYTDTQIGSLNAIYSLPNIFLVVIGGVLVDRFSARLMVLATTALCLVGAVVTALGTHYPVMVTGRLLFGIGSETLAVAVLVALAQWFTGRYFALLFALNTSLSRLGSYLADRSPSFAGELYEKGWQPPLWLAAGFAAASFLGAVLYFYIDRREAPRGTLALPPRPERFAWRHLLRFRSEYWLLVAVCVTFYSVIFPFRSTFAIKYLQEAQGFTLAQAEHAEQLRVPRRGVRHPGVRAAAGSARPQRAAAGCRCGAAAAELPGDRCDARAVDGAARSELLVPACDAVADRGPLFARGEPGHRLRSHDHPAKCGTVRREPCGRLHQRYESRERCNPGGYAPMLWFFGLLSLVAFVCTGALWLRDQRREALPAAPAPAAIEP